MLKVGAQDGLYFSFLVSDAVLMDTNPTITPYQLMGGAEGINKLVTSFYRIMDSDPKARSVRAVHGASLTMAAEKLNDFLSGWLGGPPLFMMKHGHPRMRMRHMNFAIGKTEREEWLYCMEQAMKENNLSESLILSLRDGFQTLAEKIQNKN